MDFERKIVMNSDVHYISIPIDLVKYLGITENSTLIIRDDKGRHGKFISMFVKKEE